ncbi:hypothetical protein, partial [Erysipelothrix inopinata]
ITNHSINEEYQSDLDKEIINAYSNIENIPINDPINIETKLFSFIKKVNNLDGNINALEQLSTDISKFSLELDGINRIFTVRNNENKLVFPLGNIMKYVLESDLEKFTRMGEKEIGIILLSLSIFRDTEKYKENVAELNKLLKSCNIVLFDYISEADRDENFVKNLVDNGLIVISAKSKNKIYIRTTKSKDYFDGGDHYVQSETNIKGEEIAWFVIKEINNYEFKSGNDIIKERNPKQILRLLDFVIGDLHYNVFAKDAFYFCNQELFITNDFTFRDEVIIFDKKSHRMNSSDVVYKLIENYRLQFFYDNLSSFNNVTLGFIAELILKCGICTDDLLDLTNENDTVGLQERILTNYIDSGEISLINLVDFLTIWLADLEYTAEKNNFKSKHVKDLKGFYPIQFSDNFYSVVTFAYIENFDFLSLQRQRDVFSIEKSDTPINYNDNRLGFLDRDGNIYNDNGESKDITYSYYLEIGDEKIVNEDIDQLGKLFRKISIESACYVPLGIFLSLNKVGIDQILKIMDLQKSGLCFDFDTTICESIYFFRLVNHLVYYEIYDQESVEAFVKLISVCHDIIDFNVILSKHIKNLDKNCLLLTKDHLGNDSTAQMAIKDYCTKPNQRNNLIGFSQTISLKKENNSYNFNSKDSKINRIEIVFDLTQSGKSTLETLNHYMVDEISDGFRPRIICEDNYVLVTDICCLNECPLIIEVFAGSVDSKEKIETFMNGFSISNWEVNYLTMISKIVDDNFVNLWKTAYPKVTSMYGDIGHDNRNGLLKIGNFPVIREYNQPKMNIYANDEMNSNQIFNILIKKKELQY